MTFGIIDSEDGAMFALTDSPRETTSPYSSTDSQRFVGEPPKSSLRTDFERDRARILHSASLRRLGAKTQVLGPASDDFVRTRLTHSLEVAQIGRELGKMLGADPDVVDAACLSHDLGHPPFGHNGERILNELATDCGGFEGNAQSLRIVARLEPKVTDTNGHHVGLNLTRATLDAICKYPWARGEGPDPIKSEHKFSVYADDVQVFQWMRSGAPTGKRCVEAQIMDLSDDIGYSVHDVEDAIATRAFTPSSLKNSEDIEKIIDVTTEWYGATITRDELGAALDRLQAQPGWLASFDGSYHDLAALKELTSDLIGRFLVETVTATREKFGDDNLGRYRADLIVPRETRAEIQILKGIAVAYVMQPREHEPDYYQQRTILADLVEALWDAGPDALQTPFAAAWRRADTEKQRLRALIDQVATLTDMSAHRWHAQHCGMISTQL